MTKKAMQKRIQEIVGRTPDGGAVHPNDLPFVLLVLSTHPEWDEKCGPGLDRVWVASHQPFGRKRTRCFMLTRVDGSTIDISWVTAIRGKPSPRSEVLAAARDIVAPQIAAFRYEWVAKNGRQVVCPVTSDVGLASDFHVDHQAPLTFEALVDAWVKATGLEVAAIQTAESPIDGTRSTFADDRLVASWRSYHETHAQLRLVSRRANVGVLRRKAVA